MRKLIYILILLIGTFGYSQTGNFKSVDFKEMTTAEMNAFPSPTEGEQIYNTTTKSPWFYDGTQWVESAGGGGGTMTDAQVSTAFLNINPNTDLDSTDDFDGVFGSLSGVPADLLDGDDDTVYDDTAIQAEVDLNTAKVTNTDSQDASQVALTTAVNAQTDVQASLEDHETRIDGLAAGGSDGVVSDVSINGNNLDFTGTAGAENGSLDISTITAVAANTAKNDYPSADAAKVANLSGTNTGDQDLSGFLTNPMTIGLEMGGFGIQDVTSIDFDNGTNNITFSYPSVNSFEISPDGTITNSLNYNHALQKWRIGSVNIEDLGGGTDDQTASEVTYDNTTSGLTATDVQAAVDEVYEQARANAPPADYDIYNPVAGTTRATALKDGLTNFESTDALAVFNHMKGEISGRTNPSLTVTAQQGTYLFSDTFVWDLDLAGGFGDSKFYLFGQRGSNFNKGGANSNGTFTIENGASVFFKGFDMYSAVGAGYSIQSTSTGADTEDGCSRCFFDDLNILNEGDAMKMVNPWYNNFRDNVIKSRQGIAVEFRNETTVGNSFGNSKSTNNWYRFGPGVEDSGLKFTSSTPTGGRITLTDFVNDHVQVFNQGITNNSTALRAEQATNLTFSSSYFEDAENAIYLDEIRGVSFESAYASAKHSGTVIEATANSKGFSFKGRRIDVTANETVLAIADAGAWLNTNYVYSPVNNAADFTSISIGANRRRDVRLEKDGSANLATGLFVSQTKDLDPYDNTTSGLTATNKQDAIDEIAAGSGSFDFAANNTYTGNNTFDGTVTLSSLFNAGTKATAVNNNGDIIRLNNASTVEQNAGTETQVRGFSPAIVKNMIDVHASGGSSDLNGLSDVTLLTPSNGEVLKYTGTDWENEQVDGSEVSFTSAGTLTANTVSVALDELEGMILSNGKTYTSLTTDNATIPVNSAINAVVTTSGGDFTTVIPNNLPIGLPIRLQAGEGNTITYERADVATKLYLDFETLTLPAADVPGFVLEAGRSAMIERTATNEIRAWCADCTEYTPTVNIFPPGITGGLNNPDASDLTGWINTGLAAIETGTVRPGTTTSLKITDNGLDSNQRFSRIPMLSTPANGQTVTIEWYQLCDVNTRGSVAFNSPFSGYTFLVGDGTWQFRSETFTSDGGTVNIYFGVDEEDGQPFNVNRDLYISGINVIYN